MLNFTVIIIVKENERVRIMDNSTNENIELIKKINIVLNEFENFEKAEINPRGDIIIKNKINENNKSRETVLTNVFKHMINDDIKKNRV